MLRYDYKYFVKSHCIIPLGTRSCISKSTCRNTAAVGTPTKSQQILHWHDIRNDMPKVQQVSWAISYSFAHVYFKSWLFYFYAKIVTFCQAYKLAQSYMHTFLQLIRIYTWLFVLCIKYTTASVWIMEIKPDILHKDVNILKQGMLQML